MVNVLTPGAVVTVSALVASTRLSGWPVLDTVFGPSGDLVNVFADPGDYALLLAVIPLDDGSCSYGLVRSAHGQAWLPLEELSPDGRFT